LVSTVVQIIWWGNGKKIVIRGWGRSQKQGKGLLKENSRYHPVGNRGREKDDIRRRGEGGGRGRPCEASLLLRRGKGGFRQTIREKKQLYPGRRKTALKEKRVLVAIAEERIGGEEIARWKEKCREKVRDDRISGGITAGRGEGRAL